MKIMAKHATNSFSTIKLPEGQCTQTERETLEELFREFDSIEPLELWLQHVMSDQKDEIQRLLVRIDSSCLDTKQNQVSTILQPTVLCRWELTIKYIVPRLWLYGFDYVGSAIVIHMSCWITK
jgi:hypothetical protein